MQAQNTAAKTFKPPLFKDLSDDSLRTEYWGWRALMYNGAAIGAAASTCRALRCCEIIEAIARKRRISLAK